MSNDPFAEQPGEHSSDWGGDPSAAPPPGSAPGQDADPGAGLMIRPASVGKRVGAYIIDGIGLTIILAIVGSILGFGLFVLGGGSGGTFFVVRIISVAVFLAYFTFMEAQAGGQTVAKMLFGIKVVAADGSPVTVQAAAMRRLPFVIGSIIPGPLGGLITFGLLLTILITSIQDEPEHRGLHDKWAGTRVIDA